jgi:hypothetical protein
VKVVNSSRKGVGGKCGAISSQAASRILQKEHHNAFSFGNVLICQSLNAFSSTHNARTCLHSTSRVCAKVKNNESLKQV